MAFENPANHARVNKMREQFRLIARSAKSNRVSGYDLHAFIADLILDIKRETGIDYTVRDGNAAPEEATPPVSDGTKDPALQDAYRKLSDEQRKIADLYETLREFMGS